MSGNILTEFYETQKESDKKPWITWLTMVTILGLFVVLNIGDNYNSLFNSSQELDGKWWMLVVSAFMHIRVGHMLINLLLIWALGSVIEQEIGWLWCLLLYVLVALVSTGAELIITRGITLGASGIVYGLFGFSFIGQRRFERFKKLFAYNIHIFFFLGLVVGFILFAKNIANLASFAHLFGFLFGMAYFYLYKIKNFK